VSGSKKRKLSPEKVEEHVGDRRKPPKERSGKSKLGEA